MTKQVEKLAVLFADVCGSTALYEMLGDDMARRVISGCIDIMVGVLPQYDGKLVKTIGDEILCTFPTAEDVFHASCAMQSAMTGQLTPQGNQLYVRIGFYYGDVILENGDVFGDTVNVAARVAAITRAGQIMTSRKVVDSLPEDLRKKTRHIMRAEFKGKQDEFDIFNVIWETDDLMSTRVGMPAFRKPADSTESLVLSYRSIALTIDNGNRKARLGREASCDIVVLGNLASRHHAVIEFRSGKFVLSDQSSNGTYVKFADGHVVRLAREELILQGKGDISLGQSFRENPSEILEFSINTRPAD